MKHASVAMAVAVAACAPPGPQAIADKGRSCDYCRMTISDERFGGQLITRKGKVYAFDAIECLASYYLQNGVAGDGSSLWVADFANPGHWVEARNAVFVRNDAHQSPMGLNLVALRTDADKAANQVQGTTLRWQEVLALVQSHHGTSSDHAEAVGVAR
jgi:copper chaperone NosL